MTRTRSVKIIKEQERKAPEITQREDAAADPNRWSTAVSSWVEEFQQQRRLESLPGFDSLFKDALLSGKADIGTKPSARKRVLTERKKKRLAHPASDKGSILPQVT